MVLISRFHKKCRIAYLAVSLVALALAALFIPNVRLYKSEGNNIYTLMINGKEMGKTDTETEAREILNDARRQLAAASDDLVLIDADSRIVGSEVLKGATDSREQVLANVKAELAASVKETMQRAFTVKIDEYMVSVSNEQEVISLLEASLNKYDENKKFYVELVKDSLRELPVVVPVIHKVEAEKEDKNAPVRAEDYLDTDGVFKAFDTVLANVEVNIEPGFEDYDYGITDMRFANTVEVVESYIPSKEVKSLEAAIDEVTKDKEQKTIYEVVSGDTLSGISGKTGISVDDLVALNDILESSRSMIHVGDELTITVPKPELSVSFDSLFYYEGTYEADVIYVYNDDWYTTKEVTLQDPTSGYHKAVEKTTYLNGEIKNSEIIKEEIIVEAVPKIVEKGTKIPPTYIWPCSSWRITSGYGSYRTVTVRGMTSYHPAIDIAMPIGSSVWASCGGTVIHSGWMGSYGYCVFIRHPDGRETRYAHLSRVLVSKGQSVAQGQKIGLSGNTGASTGPHLHFEMRQGGSPINLLNAVSR